MSDEEDELARLREQLRHAQRMQSVGTLAAGLAHDLNNAITAILGLAELAARELSDDSSRKDLDTIAREAARAGELTHALLAYGRRGLARRTVLTVDDVIDDVEPLVSRLAAERLVVERRGTAAVTVEGDPAALRHAVVNLCLNSADAIDGSGRITLATEARRLDAVTAARLAIEPGVYAAITVSDTGHGMDDTVRARMFEPFFTTKQERGSGLGLAMVLDTIRTHGGAVDCDSAPGRGTTFTLYLPESSEPVPVGRLGRGTGSMFLFARLALVVDESSATREIAARVLRGLGMIVIEAADLSEASDILLARHADIRLVLVDPLLRGLDATRLRELRARAAVPFVLVGASCADELLAVPQTSALSAPYRIDELREHVLDLLEP